ncbi:MAG: hypothetical protein J6J36_06740 [Clostridia bacterium]|nr:hypothetical protein [Clostridia bacterium]
MEQNLKEEKQLLKKIMISNLKKAEKEMTINLTEFLSTESQSAFAKFKANLSKVQSLTEVIATMIKGE